MFYKFLKIANTSNITLSRYLLSKTNSYLVYANSHRYYCKGPCSDDKNKKYPPGHQNAMNQLPKPDCPWYEDNKSKNKKYRNILLLGLLFTAATLAALYYKVMMVEKPKIVHRKTRQFQRPKPTCREPAQSASLPKHVPYLLIGGGTASFSAFRAIKSSDPTAKVLVISNECHNPYMRPPLSKEMWFTENEANVSKLIFKQWNGTERSLFYEPDDFYSNPQEIDSSTNGGVAIASGYTVKKIEVSERKVILDDDTEIEYDKCLIATGAKPKNLDVFESANDHIKEKVTLFRDIFDFQELNEICSEAKSVVIVGGGFLGSELACALGKKGKRTSMKVQQVFREAGNMGRILPEYLSSWTTKKVIDEGVKVIPNTEVEDVSLNDKKELVLHLNSGRKITADHVIVAVGVEPNTQLAETSELEVDPELGGFLVNAEMEARSHLYVAGDCSCFYDTKLGRRRVEHHDHAVVSGRLAGENMTGAAKPYLHQSMFWSDLGPDVGYEAIGIVDSTLPTVGVFAKATDKDNPKAIVTATNESIRSKTEESAEPIDPDNKESHDSKEQDYGKGIIFYLKNEIVVGIVLWNVFNRMSVARQVLKDERKYDDLNEVAKLFNIHEEEATSPNE